MERTQEKKARIDQLFNDKCIKKNTFYDEEGAHRAAKRAKKLRGAIIKPYKCPFCRLYHLTSKKADKYWENIKRK